MKKMGLKYKILLTMFSIVILFSLLFFSFQYHWNFSMILSDIFYFPFHIGIPITDVQLEGIVKEKEEEIIDLKNLLEIKGTLSEFHLESAVVINRNTAYWGNQVTINKGKKDGISEGMAVIDGLGLIGKIEKVGITTSVVKLITSNDKNNKISVKIWLGDNTINKILTGDENNHLIISGIDNNLDIQAGSLVTTSGLSDIYPSGIDIGYVEKVENDKFGISKKAYVQHISDLDNLRFVFVLSRSVSE